MADVFTIDDLNALAALTAADEVPVWDSEESGEPTKKITAQNMTNSVKTLGSLVNTTEMNNAIAQSTADVIRTGDVVNNLTSTATNAPLSAAQGKALNDKIATQDISSSVTSDKGTFSLKQVHTILDAVYVTVELTLTSQVGVGQTIITGLPKAKGNYVNIFIKYGQTPKLAYMDGINLIASETLSSGASIAINYSYVKQ